MPQNATQIDEIAKRNAARKHAYNIDMEMDAAQYDPRYLAGIVLFNRGDFFEAHEVWEDLWAESAGLERSFYQGLIQAAVGLFHFSGGNLRGAAKLYRTSRAYMEPCGSPFLGLDVVAFWRQMERCSSKRADQNVECS